MKDIAGVNSKAGCPSNAQNRRPSSSKATVELPAAGPSAKVSLDKIFEFLHTET